MESEFEYDDGPSPTSNVESDDEADGVDNNDDDDGELEVVKASDPLFAPIAPDELDKLQSSLGLDSNGTTSPAESTFEYDDENNDNDNGDLEPTFEPDRDFEQEQRHASIDDTEREPEPESELQSEPEPEPDSQPEPETQRESEPEPETQPELESQPEPEPEAELQHEPEIPVAAQPEYDTETKQLELDHDVKQPPDGDLGNSRGSHSNVAEVVHVRVPVISIDSDGSVNVSDTVEPLVPSESVKRKSGQRARKSSTSAATLMARGISKTKSKFTSSIDSSTPENLENAVKDQIRYLDVTTRSRMTLAGFQGKNRVFVRPTSASMLAVLRDPSQQLAMLLNIAWVLAYYYPDARKTLVELASMRNRRATNGYLAALVCDAFQRFNLVPQAFWLYLNGIVRTSRSEFAKNPRPGSPQLKELLDDELVHVDKPNRPGVSSSNNVAFAKVFPAGHVSIVVANSDNPDGIVGEPAVNVATQARKGVGPPNLKTARNMPTADICSVQGKGVLRDYEDHLMVVDGKQTDTASSTNSYDSARYHQLMVLHKTHCSLDYETARKLAVDISTKQHSSAYRNLWRNFHIP